MAAVRGYFLLASFSAIPGGGPLLEDLGHDALHFVPGRWFAGPDFKLTRRLVHEHFNSGDHFRAGGLGQLHEASYRRIVDHLEDIACPDFILAQWRFLRVAHAD